MMRAILRLALITIGSLILIVFAVVFVRWMGFQQAFAPPPHPWFAQTYWQVFAPTTTCSENGQIIAPSESWKIMLTVHYRDGNWEVDCPEAHVKLDDVLKSSSHTDWILHIRANDSTYLDNLVDIVGKYDNKKKFGISGDSQRVSRFLRKKAPQWLYAADASSLLRMQMFTSLWIETAMDFWPDFVLANEQAGLPSRLSPRLAQELERRHKRILWDETKGDSKPDFPIHGIVTTRPDQ